jgi:hypothetical protein
MTTLVKVRISSLVSTMLIRQHEELNMVKGSACNCFHPTWIQRLAHNGNKNVTNYIMGPYAHIAMGVM